ncbi:hypothetical protein GCM10023085_74870 [Actinomadura viridis]
MQPRTLSSVTAWQMQTYIRRCPLVRFQGPEGPFPQADRGKGTLIKVRLP